MDYDIFHQDEIDTQYSITPILSEAKKVLPSVSRQKGGSGKRNLIWQETAAGTVNITS